MIKVAEKKQVKAKPKKLSKYALWSLKHPNGEPSIVEERLAEEIDLSPIEFDCIDYENKKLRFKERLILKPELDDSGQLYTISYPKFNLETFAYTRQEIIDGVKSDIRFLWDIYARATDEELAEGALELKQRLLSNIEECANG